MNVLDERDDAPVAGQSCAGQSPAIGDCPIAHPEGEARSPPVPPPALETSTARELKAPESQAPQRAGLLRRLHHAVKEIEPWGILLAILAFWIAFSDRSEERTVRAWQLLTTQAPGNSGKAAALEYLNSEDGLLCAEWLRGRLGWLHDEENISCLILFKAPTPLTGIDLSPPDPEDNGTPEDLSDDPTGTYLVQVKLPDADLSEANLKGANLNGADLRGANLFGANLNDTDLRDANLSNADLTSVHLLRAELSAVNLKGADLGSDDEYAAPPNLSGAYLHRVDLRGMYMPEANLSGAHLIGTDLSGADLTGAILWSADLRGANLAGANLNRAQLLGADLVDAISLQQEQLDYACGNKYTKLPKGLTIKPCD